MMVLGMPNSIIILVKNTADSLCFDIWQLSHDEVSGVIVNYHQVLFAVVRSPMFLLAYRVALLATSELQVDIWNTQYTSVLFRGCLL